MDFLDYLSLASCGLFLAIACYKCDELRIICFHLILTKNHQRFALLQLVFSAMGHKIDATLFQSLDTVATMIQHEIVIDERSDQHYHFVLHADHSHQYHGSQVLSGAVCSIAQLTSSRCHMCRSFAHSALSSMLESSQTFVYPAL